MISTLIAQTTCPCTTGTSRPLLLLAFAGRVLKDIIVANFAVARVVLGPADAIRPVFVRVPLDIRGDFPVTVLASVVSLTPGTVSTELEENALWVHALSEQNPEQLVQQIKRRYEAPIGEIFQC